MEGFRQGELEPEALGWGFWFVPVVITWCLYLSVVPLTLDVQGVIGEVVAGVSHKSVIRALYTLILANFVVERYSRVRILPFLLAVLYHNYLIARPLPLGKRLLLLKLMILVKVDEFEICQIPEQLSKPLLLLQINYFLDFWVIELIRSWLRTSELVNLHFWLLKTVLDGFSNLPLFLA